MNTISLFMRSASLIMLAFFMAVVCQGFQIAGPTIAGKEGSRTVLNGIWMIESPPQEAAEPKSDAFLPPGLQIRLKVLGPTRLAIEENRDNELGGELTLMSPFPEGICSAAIGAWLCKDGKVSGSSQPVPLEVFFAFDRWSAKDAEENKFSFFARRGAQAGAQFVDIVLRSQDQRPTIEWQLWMRDHNHLVGHYLLGDPGKKLRRQIDQTWQRVATQPQTK